MSHCVVGPLATLAGPVDNKRYALVVQRVGSLLILKATRTGTCCVRLSLLNQHRPSNVIKRLNAKRRKSLSLSVRVSDQTAAVKPSYNGKDLALTSSRVVPAEDPE